MRSDFGDGLTWWAHPRGVVEGEGEVNLVNTAVVVTDIDTGDVLQVRDAASGDLITLTTNSRGETPPTFLLPREQAYLSAGGNTYTSETVELRGILLEMRAALDEFAILRQQIKTAPQVVVYDGAWDYTGLDPDRVTYFTSAHDAAAEEPDEARKRGNEWVRRRAV